jgi:Ca-activated chloride channel family protein
VRIVEPATDRTDAERLIGPVDVEAEIRGPGARDLERVEFYWNADLVATRFGPPWRQRVIVPDSAPRGFVRVVAWLADGTAVEDVVFLNSPGAAERLDVALVELYLVVTDRDGRPVRGLEAEAFAVEEDGVRQSIATFAAAGELPLTVGLAIDASASMFVKLPRVQEAAADFVLGLLGERDKAFVVGFGSEPSLFEETTAQAAGVVRGISALRPQGKTAVWKAIVYSLVQLQGAPGRKALVVFSDGADEDEEFPYRTCLRFARRLGIPIYVIVANSEIVRTQGKSGAVRSFLDRLEGLVNAVGGRVYLRRIGDDLSTVYQEIAEELRSQYLLAYYPRRSAAGDAEGWCEVEVDIDRPGLVARTLAGYYR